MSLVLISILAPVVSFSSNLVLCWLFPRWGNYLTLGWAAACAVGTATLLNAETSKDRSTRGIGRALAILFGCGIGLVMTIPVVVKVSIAVIAQIGGMLVAYSKT
jgi:hypothetical protein